jgi:hypothetical protein
MGFSASAINLSMNSAMKAKADMMKRKAEAAAKETDPFWRAAKKPLVLPEELV